MAWIGLLALAAAQVTVAVTCEEALEGFVRDDLMSRIFSHKQTGEGLDYLGGYPECFNTNGTYVTVFWMNNNVPTVSYGFCLPNYCELDEAQKIMESLSSRYDLSGQIKSTKISVKQIDLSKTKQKPEIANFFIISFIILVILEVLGSFYSLFYKKDDFLSCFSLIINFKNLFSGSKSSDNLRIIDGIRSLASMSIILLHSFFFEIFFAVSNRLEYNKSFTSLYCTFMISLCHAIDVFFLLSGFLMSFLTIKELQNKGNHFSWTKFMARRVIRYLPVLYFLVGIERSTYGANPTSAQLIISHVVNVEPESPWWSALFLIHNLIPVDGSLYLAWSWTTSVDFQFYLASCIVLYAYQKNKTWGYTLSAFYVIFSIIYTTYLSFIYQLSPSPLDSMLDFKQSNLVYIKPIPRIPAFLIGLVLGLVYLKATQKKGQVSVAYVVKDSWGEKFESFLITLVKNDQIRKVFYLVGLVFLTFSVFGPHYLVVFGEKSLGVFTKAVWVAVKRLIFTLGFSFFAFPLLFGYLGVVGEFLKMKIFSFLGKISYTVYLVHPLVFVGMFMTGNDMHRVDWQSLQRHFVGLFGMSVVVSSILQVLVESPFLNLAQKYLRR